VWARCSIVDAGGEHLCREWQQWQTYEEGVFSFRGLVDGDYFLVTKITTGQLWWYPGTLDFAEATPVTITIHSTVTGITWSWPSPGKGVGP
jgi:hypothetical protein